MIHNEPTHKKTKTFIFLPKVVVQKPRNETFDEENFSSWYPAELEKSVYRKIKLRSSIALIVKL